MALKLGIQTYQILTNDDEVCIPCLSSILFGVSKIAKKFRRLLWTTPKGQFDYGFSPLVGQHFNKTIDGAIILLCSNVLLFGPADWKSEGRCNIISLTSRSVRKSGKYSKSGLSRNRTFSFPDTGLFNTFRNRKKNPIFFASKNFSSIFFCFLFIYLV